MTVISKHFLILSLPLLLSSAFAAALVPTAGGQSAYPPSPQAIVHLVDGTLQGAEPAPGVRAYLGIRYAKPPVGPLRWQPPQPFGSWTGSLPATKHGNPCPQHRSGWNNNSADHGTEDCLFLNVWTPANGSHLPVMVYLHGGSNVAGSAAEELSNGLALVPRDVVLVTLDYRLGIFGFLRSPALDAESAHGASGNYGILDQIAALEWVKRNIAQFGGDPGNVMVFGQSAGAVDTGLLMTSPLARGLFSRALEESGQVLGLMPTATKKQSEDAWGPVVQSLGTDLARMRAASTAEVLEADRNAPKPPPMNWWGYRGASVDGWVLPALPSEVFAAGKEAPVPLVIGVNAQEIVPQNQPEAVTRHLIEASLPPDVAARLEAVYSQPSSQPGNDPMLGNMGARWTTDRDFRCPARQIASWHAAHGFPTYAYQFDRPAPGQAIAQHSSELRFVFSFFPEHKESAADDQASAAIQGYWASFAKTGTPGADRLPKWPRFNPADRAYMHFAQDDPTPRPDRELGGAACDLLPAAELPGHP